MMKKIALLVALCTISVESSFALIPQLRQAARMRAQQNQQNMHDPIQTKIQDEMRHLEPTCELLIDFCVELERRAVTTKESPEFKAIDQWYTNLVNAGALKDCAKKGMYWIKRLSIALEDEKTAENALSQEMLYKLRDDIRIELKKLHAQQQKIAHS